MRTAYTISQDYYSKPKACQISQGDHGQNVNGRAPRNTLEAKQ